MTPDIDLSHFIRDALERGQPSDEVRSALSQAGWTDAEIDVALQGWMVTDGKGVVPRPIRSTAARDAFFYALLFIVFGAIVGNVLVLWFGQITMRLPDSSDRVYSGQISGLRWSIAAVVVFLPVFWWLDRSDRRAATTNPAHRYNTVRRWLSAIALLCAVIALLTDALFLLYRWLDGQMTLRFALRCATVAIVALIVMAYFRDNRRMLWSPLALPAGWAMSALAVTAVGLTLASVGGPAQGRLEQQDRARINNLYALSSDLLQCQALSTPPLPAEFDPMDCAINPGQLTGFANEVRYARLTPDRFSLCVAVEAPEEIRRSGIRVDGNTACLERDVN